MWVGLWRLLGGSLLCGAGYVLYCSLLFSWESGAAVGTGSHLYNAALMTSAAIFLFAGWAVLNWSVRGWAVSVLGGGIIGVLFWRFATDGSDPHQLGPRLALGAIGGALLLAVFGFAIASIPAVRQRLGDAGDAWRSTTKITLNTDFQFKGGGSASTNEHINGPSGFTAFLIGCYLVAFVALNPGATFGLFLGLTFPFTAWLVEGAAHRHVFETAHLRSWSDQWAAAMKWWSVLILVFAAIAAFVPNQSGETDEAPSSNPGPLPADAGFTGRLSPMSPGGAHGVLRLRGRPGKEALLRLSVRGLPVIPPPQRYVIWSLADERAGTPMGDFAPPGRRAFNARAAVSSFYLETANVAPRIEITRATSRAAVTASRHAAGKRFRRPQGPVIMRGHWHLDGKQPPG